LPRGTPRCGVLSAPCETTADEELLEGIRLGSEPHFNVLYERYFQRIYNFSYARVRNHADVEEIVQETFTAVFRSVEHYRGQSSLLSWIYGIAKNTVNNHLRRSKAAELRLDRTDPGMVQATGALAHCTPEEGVHLREYADAINERLESVSTWQCEVFRLRHLEDLPIEEIAARTRRSNDAVRSSLYRVKRMLVEAAGLEWTPA
jgi:RNA polymerase sigma-70 factor (ECF subfamily)